MRGPKDGEERREEERRRRETDDVRVSEAPEAVVEGVAMFQDGAVDAIVSRVEDDAVALSAISLGVL